MTALTEQQALNAERALVGGLLLDGSRLQEVEATAGDFVSESHAQVFTAIHATALAGEPVDILTVSERLERDTGRKWLHVVGQLAASAVTSANVAAYSRMVRDGAVIRKALAIAEALTVDVASPGAIDVAIRDLMGLHRARKNYEVTAVDAYAAALKNIDDVYNSDGGMVGVPSGVRDLDECLGGLHASDLIVIGARPSMGKTALMLNMADRCERACGVISAEQGHEQIGLRMIAINGRISAHNMRLAKIADDEWPKMTNILSMAKNKRMWIYDKPAPTIDDVVRQARKWKHQNAIDILFLDYVQRIKAPGANSRREEVAAICMALKELARELDIPVVALAQVSRAVEARANKRPLISDLKEAGEIEQEADQIIFLYRDEVYNEDSKDRGTAELIVSKNRHGPCGMIRVVWRGEFLRFEDFLSHGEAAR